MVRPERFELPTAWFVARYSIQLSYGRIRKAVYYEIILARCQGQDPQDGKDGGERGIRTLDGVLSPILP